MWDSQCGQFSWKTEGSISFLYPLFRMKFYEEKLLKINLSYMIDIFETQDYKSSPSIHLQKALISIKFVLCLQSFEKIIIIMLQVRGS